MSSHGSVSIANRVIAWQRNGLSEELKLLFKRADFKSEIQLDEYGEGFETQKYVISTQTLLDRLDVLGVTANTCSEMFDRLVRHEVGFIESWGDFDADSRLSESNRRQLELLDRLDLPSWQQRIKEQWGEEISYEPSAEPGSTKWLLDLWEFADEIFLLRAVGEAFPEDDVELDVSDLVGGGWVEIGGDPSEEAFSFFESEYSSNSPAIVLAEGSTDISILSTAFGLLRPQLNGYVRFFEFAGGAEGGASALVKLVKAIAAAGIRNRFIAVFDNDAAAADCLRNLEIDTLPRNITVLTLPDIEIGKNYPTVGPAGEEFADVNGLAGSIELYLGTDILDEGEGAQIPIQWSSYMPRVSRYQGRFTRKNEIHKRFEAKARMAIANKESMKNQDWSGLELIVKTIVEAARAIPRTQISSAKIIR